MEIQVVINGIRVRWIEKAVMNYAMAMIRLFGPSGPKPTL